MDHERRLLRHGFMLFFLALLTGLIALYPLTNPRMAVAAHVEGLVNGIFLMLLGLAWQRLELPVRAGFWTYWAGLNGAYANWVIPLFSAVVGASRPRLAGAGFSAAPWAESLMPLSGVGGVLAQSYARSSSSGRCEGGLLLDEYVCRDIRHSIRSAAQPPM